MSQESPQWAVWEPEKLYRVSDLAERWRCTFAEARVLVCESGEDGQYVLASSGEPLLDRAAIESIERVAGEALREGRHQEALCLLVERRISELRDVIEYWPIPRSESPVTELAS